MLRAQGGHEEAWGPQQQDSAQRGQDGLNSRVEEREMQISPGSPGRPMGPPHSPLAPRGAVVPPREARSPGDASPAPMPTPSFPPGLGRVRV